MRWKEMVLNKKGQSMSINVIIVAVLALVVLVVMVMIFTGRIGVFEKSVSKEGQTELIKLKLSYGDCAPNSVSENSFLTQYGSAVSDSDKVTVKANFESEISRCKEFSDNKVVCESTNCKWS